MMVYNNIDCLNFRTTAVLSDPRTDMLAKATDPFSGQTNCCCPRIQSITVKY